MEENYRMTEQESLQVISSMIAKAKASYHERGTISMLWGLIIALCALETWAELHYGFDLPFNIWNLTFVAVIPTIILSIRENKMRKVKSYEDDAMNYVWSCFGISMFLVIHTNIMVNVSYEHIKDLVENAGQPRPSDRFMEFSSAYHLIIYGIPTLVTAWIKNFKPMLVGGIICWVSAVAAVYTPIEVDMLLLALAAVTSWLIPGIILQRRYLKHKAAANV